MNCALGPVANPTLSSGYNGRGGIGQMDRQIAPEWGRYYLGVCTKRAKSRHSDEGEALV